MNAAHALRNALLKRLLKLKNRLADESLNSKEEEKSQGEQVKISPQPTQPTSFQSAPSEKIKPPEEPLEKEAVKPEQKPKKEKKQKKANVPIVYKNNNKVIKINGKNVLMVPSGFEIMTKDGWRPVMMRADRLYKGY